MKKLFFFISITSLSVSCKKDAALWQVQNLNGNKISAFGHGGMGIAFKYPIDTYESFEPCLRIGAAGTEMDVQISKDSVLVLYHHQKLEDGTSCDGILASKKWPEMQNCVHACPYSTSVNLITATELFDKINNKDELIFTFDCKLYNSGQSNTNYRSIYANTLIKHINNYNIKTNSFIESSDTSFLRMLQNKEPELKLFFYTGNYTDGLAVSKKIKLFGITIDHNYITQEEITNAHSNNLRVTLFNMQTEKQNMDAIQKNPDFMQSDKIIHLLKIFGEYKEQPIKKKFKW
ncbi:MAG: hypothetical protein H0W73_12675 [Bacteroidetes bacterium]|nr:hypothetical protein [Bacteroidota bacterium]